MGMRYASRLEAFELFCVTGEMTKKRGESCKRDRVERRLFIRVIVSHYCDPFFHSLDTIYIYYITLQ